MRGVQPWQRERGAGEPGSRVRLLYGLVLAGGALLGVATLGAAAEPKGKPEGKEKVTETQDRLREVQRKLEQERQRARDAARRERDVAKDLRAIEADLQQKSRDLKELQAKLRGSSERIGRLTQEIRVGEGRLGQSRAQLARRLRAIYKQGRLAYVRLLLGADDLSGAATRFKYLASIAGQDRRLAAGYEASLQELKAKREALEASKHEVATAQEVARTRQHEIAEEQGKRQVLLAKVREEKLGHLTAAKKLEEASRDLQGLITRLAREDTAARRRGSGTPAPVGPPPFDGAQFATLKGKLPWPTTGSVASSFGKQEHPKFRTVTYNRGIEISAPIGRPVLAVYDGTVLYSDWFRGYGRLVILDHGDGYFTLYAHASELLVKVGDQVARGHAIARVGDSGSLEGPQLYFEVRHRGKPQDPLAWLTPSSP